MKVSRRDFIATTAIGSASLALDLQGQSKSAQRPPRLVQPKKPVIICAANGYNYLDRGYAVLTSGGDTLDAVMQVITGPEDDPNDDSVGLGGLPNEDCVVELDACCMHGPTRMAGSVAGVRDIKNVSLLAKTVMEHTGHVMLVGEGAQKFGFDDGLSQGEPADRALAQDLAAVERNHVERRLVGTGAGQSEIQVPRYGRQCLRDTTTSASRGWRSWRRRSASSRSFAWPPSNACCIRRPARFIARR